MVRARASTLIQRPADAVFAFVADDFAHNYRRWSPEVQHLEVLTQGPLRIGSRARQVRVDQGRRTDTRFRVVALERPRRVCFAEERDQFRIEYLMEPAGADPAAAPTRLAFVFVLTRLELYMRPFEKLIRAAVEDGARRTVSNIKGLMEGAGATGRVPPDP